MTQELISRLKEDLAKRLEVLSRGIKPPMFRGKVLKGFLGLGVGAGPQGKQFYVIDAESQKSTAMVSVPIYPEGQPLHEQALKTELAEGSLMKLENGLILKSVPIPEFYNLKLKDGSTIASRGFFGRHAYNTITSVLGYECIHFQNNEPCKYCEIGTVGEEVRGFPAQSELDAFVEGAKLVCENSTVRSLTITAGTFAENRNEGLRRYIGLCKDLKETIPTLDIHIQHEPITELSLYQESAKYSNNAGIFLELLDEKLRKEICPGKARISREEYIENYKVAVEAYGRGNVVTTCLLGFGESLTQTLEAIDEYAALGVKTSVLFVRPNNSNLKNYVPTYLKHSTEELVTFFLDYAAILNKHGIGYKTGNGAGCIGCQGCSALKEADKIFSLMNT